MLMKTIVQVCIKIKPYPTIFDLHLGIFSHLGWGQTKNKICNSSQQKILHYYRKFLANNVTTVFASFISSAVLQACPQRFYCYYLILSLAQCCRFSCQWALQKFCCDYLVFSFVQCCKVYCQCALAIHRQNTAVVQAWAKKMMTYQQ